MNSFDKNKILIVIACGVIVTASILFFLSRNEYSNVLDLRRVFEEKSETLKTQQKKLSALQKVDQDSTEVQKIQSFAEIQLPDDINGSIFVSSIEKLGNTMQVTPLSVSIGSTATSTGKDKNASPSFSFSVTFVSSFQTMIQFLAEMEKLDRFNAISSLSLSPNEQGVSVNLTGTIYQYSTVTTK